MKKSFVASEAIVNQIARDAESFNMPVVQAVTNRRFSTIVVKDYHELFSVFSVVYHGSTTVRFPVMGERLKDQLIKAIKNEVRNIETDSGK